MAANDWSKPGVSDTYTNVLAYIKERVDALAIMSFGSISGIPDESIRWNASTKRFEIWDSTGSTWSHLESGTWDLDVSKLGGAAAADYLLSSGHEGAGGAVHADATTSTSGFMSAADKTKLDDATDDATASTVVMRNGAGNFKSATPSATNDVVIKSFVQTAVDGVDNAVAASTPDVLALRDSNGDCAFDQVEIDDTTPTASNHATRKDWIESEYAKSDDTKIYSGSVNDTATVSTLPTGWTCSKSAGDQYTVTHNLGTTSYVLNVNDIMVSGAYTKGVSINIVKGTNAFYIYFYDDLTWSTPQVKDFDFILIKH